MTVVRADCVLLDLQLQESVFDRRLRGSLRGVANGHRRGLG
jgi:hypothetical protein